MFQLVVPVPPITNFTGGAAAATGTARLEKRASPRIITKIRYNLDFIPILLR
jgi:hypothetical protein